MISLKWISTWQPIHEKTGIEFNPGMENLSCQPGCYITGLVSMDGGVPDSYRHYTSILPGLLLYLLIYQSKAYRQGMLPEMPIRSI